MTSRLVISVLPVRRRVRSSHSRADGLAAIRAASARSSSGTLIPASLARAASTLYTSSSTSRIWIVLGMGQVYYAAAHDVMPWRMS